MAEYIIKANYKIRSERYYLIKDKIYNKKLRMVAYTLLLNLQA